MCKQYLRSSQFAVALLATFGVAGAFADQAATPAGSRSLFGSYVNYFEARSGHAKITSIQRQASAGSSEVLSAQNVESEGATLPLFSYNVRAARDGLGHKGVIVGGSPFDDQASSQIPAKIIPVVLVLNRVATGVDPTTGDLTTAPGHVVVDPRKPDNSCLSAPNNVPVQVMLQSPLFTPTNFSFGGTFLGHTQYEDAFMRAAFFSAVQDHPDAYHVLFAPVDLTQALVLNVPPSEGVAVTDASVLGGGFCTPLSLVNIDWLDALINDQVLPAYASKGVTPATLPIFFLYDTFLTGGNPVLLNCCIGGYHSFGGFPTPAQAYSVVDFDVTGIFGSFWPDSAIGAHELGEFINDPWGINQVPPWGGTGQVAGCQSNLEVGDPLTGTSVTPVTMPNGFTYHLQELAFFSWFFGGPSLGVNGWFSNNGTFTTDAGTPCLLN